MSSTEYSTFRHRADAQHQMKSELLSSYADKKSIYTYMKAAIMLTLTIMTGTFIYLAISPQSSSSSKISESSSSSSSSSSASTSSTHSYLQGSTSSKNEITVAPKENSKPNFVFILADDLGWNSIGYQDYDLTFASPFITELAKKGVIMSNYYGQEICTPSRASLLTGRYPLSIGMQFGNVLEDGPWGMALEETTLAEALRDHGGYTNYALGKWHLGHYTPDYLPTSRGFHNYLGYVSGKNFYWSKNSPDYQQITDFMYADSNCYNVYNGTDKESYSTTIYKNMAVKTIKQHDYDKGPMFLYFASQAVHDPFADCAGNSAYEAGIPASYMDQTLYDKIKTNVVGDKRQQYAMSLVMLDNAVADLYKALEETNQLSNTYIIFASDNGACLYGGGKNAPLRGSKGTLFEGGTRVDAFIYSPLLPSTVTGSSYSGLMHVSDWFPTILDLAGVTAFKSKKGYEMDGVSQAAAVLAGDATANQRTNMVYNIYTKVKYAEFEYWNIQTNSSVGVRNSRFKLLHTFTGNGYYDSWFDYTVMLADDFNLDQRPCSQMNAGSTFEHMLFDLENDPYETTNLYYDDSYATVRAELEELVLQYSEKAREVTYGTEHSPQAYSFWTEHGSFMQPWKHIDSGTVKKCDNADAIYAPDTIQSKKDKAKPTN